METENSADTRRSCCALYHQPGAADLPCRTFRFPYRKHQRKHGNGSRHLRFVAAAVVIFVSYSIHGQQYEYLEKERIETAYGVTGLVQERKKDYESTFTREIAAGVTLCILAVIPMFAAIAFSQPDYIITATVSILLLLVAVGVFFIVWVSTINGSYVILLQEGEYTPEEKRYKKKTEVFTTAYWCIVTAIYLAWSFQTREWDKTWILWAVAGVLFGGVRAVMRGRIKEK